MQGEHCPSAVQRRRHHAAALIPPIPYFRCRRLIGARRSQCARSAHAQCDDVLAQARTDGAHNVVQSGTVGSAAQSDDVLQSAPLRTYAVFQLVRHRHRTSVDARVSRREANPRVGDWAGRRGQLSSRAASRPSVFLFCPRDREFASRFSSFFLAAAGQVNCKREKPTVAGRRGTSPIWPSSLAGSRQLAACWIGCAPREEDAQPRWINRVFCPQARSGRIWVDVDLSEAPRGGHVLLNFLEAAVGAHCCPQSSRQCLNSFYEACHIKLMSTPSTCSHGREREAKQPSSPFVRVLETSKWPAVASRRRSAESHGIPAESRASPYVFGPPLLHSAADADAASSPERIPLVLGHLELARDELVRVLGDVDLAW